jgi:predicted RNA-binding protein YlxR (DUF448 family)
VTEPRRTCIGCGAKADQRALVRLGIEGERVIVDADRKAGGRGAWVHPSPECLDKALRRRAVGRALRRPGAALDPAQLAAGLTGNPRKH